MELVGWLCSHDAQKNREEESSFAEYSSFFKNPPWGFLTCTATSKLKKQTSRRHPPPPVAFRCPVLWESDKNCVSRLVPLHADRNAWATARR